MGLMTAKTTNQDTNKTLAAALAIINRGIITFDNITSSDGRTNVIAGASFFYIVDQKPTCDIDVYWYAR